MLYFAFGSNMNKPQTERRVGRVEIFGIGVLTDYELRFNKRGRDGSGKANIVSQRGSKVEGVIFNLTEEQIVKMDQYEKGYNRTRLPVSINDQIETITTYVADPMLVNNALLPNVDYLEKLIEGAIGFSLSPAYIEKLKSYQHQ